jgi:hypothetical protein
MNLLVNSNFEEGHHHQDGVMELVVPDHWHLYFLDNEDFPGIGNPPAYRPESVVWNRAGTGPHQQKYFLDGDFCVKVFKAWAPVYFALTQHAEGLTPGRKYRFTAQVHPDIVEEYTGSGKEYAGDMWAAEARAGWSAPDAGASWPQFEEDGDIRWSEWFNMNNGNLTYGEYGDVWVEFSAPDSGEVRVWVECKAKWGLSNNWFMDAFSLVAVEGPTEEPIEEPTEEPIEEPIEEPTEEPAERPVEQEKPRGTPRIPYDRTYILLPNDIRLDMALAAMRAAHEKKSTVGFSADDAGIGDLDDRRIVCVNPRTIGTGLTQDWYDEHYPGVEFDIVEATDSTELEAKLKDAL